MMTHRRQTLFGLPAMANRTAQTLLEYAIMVGVTAVVITAMSPLLKRGIQSVIKGAADQLAPQNESEPTVDRESGYLVNAFSATRARMYKQYEEVMDNKAVFYNDRIETDAHSLANMGFTNRME